MAKEANHSSHPHFPRFIVNETLRNQTLELPESFLKENWESLSKYARLTLPTGEEWNINLKKRNDRAWLDKGWQKFAEKYSIQWGHVLVFRYEGGSRFNVLIFDRSSLEIEYPVSCQVKEEDSEGESLPQKESSVTSKRDRVFERANTMSPNFQFTLTIQQTYISRPYLFIPESPARSYFRLMGSNIISVKGEDGRSWCIKYSVGSPPLQRVCICSGWSRFSRENHIRKGDRCRFELLSNTPMAFQVTIDRISNNENGPMNDGAASHSTNRAPSVTCSAMDKFLISFKSFECENPPFFILRMTSYYVSERPKVHVPSAHARAYLKQGENGNNVIVVHGSNGKAWLVQCLHYKCAFIKKVILYKGWKDFTSDNRLRAGDTLVFELISRKPKEYNVTIIPIADHA